MVSLSHCFYYFIVDVSLLVFSRLSLINIVKFINLIIFMCFMNKVSVDRFPSLNKLNSVSILKSNDVSFIAVFSNMYWDKATIDECCLDKNVVRDVINRVFPDNKTVSFPCGQIPKAKLLKELGL